jgi:HPt (histidine-containing phosphotransfer) domain-containing protein
MNGLQWDKEFALEQAADDAELLAELIVIFRDSIQGDFSIIENGLQGNNASKVCSGAHSIKGAAASLGFNGITEVAKAIEEDSRGGSLSVAEKRLGDLKQLMEELLRL